MSLLPKGGVSWKAAQERLPSTRSVGSVLFRTRTILTFSVAIFIILLWQSVSRSAGDMQRYGDLIAAYVITSTGELSTR